MTMPSNKWEEALDNTIRGCIDDPHDKTIQEAKLAITKAVRELVKESMPEPTSAFDGSEAQVFIIATDQYQANLLKAIGDE